MPKITVIFSLLLIALGGGAFLLAATPTALIPAYAGGALLVIGGCALAFDGAAKYLMHFATIVAALGAIAPGAALAIRASQMSPLALTVNLGMFALCSTLLALQIRAMVRTRSDAARSPAGVGKSV